MKVKKTFVSLLVLLVVFSFILSGCKGGAATPAGDSGKTVTIKLTHILAPDHSWNAGAEKFKELVSAKSNGQIKVEIFPSAQLGDEVSIIENMKTGTIQMAVCSTAKSVNFVPELGLVDLPFLFKDWDHVHKVLDGEIGKELDKKMLAATGLRSLGWWDQGFRHVLTVKKPVKTMADFAGLKLRTPDSETYTKTFLSIGASPTPMAFSELYSGLETGVVDGFEGSFETTYSSNLHEVCKYITITNHIYSGAQFLIQDKFLQKLSPEMQKAIQEAAIEAKEYERKIVMERDDKNKQKLLDAGITIDETLIKNESNQLRESVTEYVAQYSKKAGIEDLVKKAKDS